MRKDTSHIFGKTHGRVPEPKRPEQTKQKGNTGREATVWSWREEA